MLVAECTEIVSVPDIRFRTFITMVKEKLVFFTGRYKFYRNTRVTLYWYGSIDN